MLDCFTRPSSSPFFPVFVSILPALLGYSYSLLFGRRHFLPFSLKKSYDFFLLTFHFCWLRRFLLNSTVPFPFDNCYKWRDVGHISFDSHSQFLSLLCSWWYLREFSYSPYHPSSLTDSVLADFLFGGEPIPPLSCRPSMPGAESSSSSS